MKDILLKTYKDNIFRIDVNNSYLKYIMQWFQYFISRAANPVFQSLLGVQSHV